MILKEWIVPIVEEYIRLRSKIREFVLQTGTIPRYICENCYTRNQRQFINDLTSEEKRVAIDIAAQVRKYQIISIRREYGTEVSVHSLRAIRDICPNPESFDSEVSEWIDKDEEGRKIYSYTVPPHTRSFKSTFLKPLFQIFDRGITFCPHIEWSHLKKGAEAKAVCLSKEEFIYTESQFQIETSYQPQKQWTKTLLFSCDACRQEISKRACPNAFEFVEYMYQNRGCLWEHVLFLSCLHKAGKQFRIIGDYTPIVVIEPEKVLISYDRKIDEDLIVKVNPSMIILFGSKKDMVPFMQIEVDIVCVDGDNILLYDSSREIQQDVSQVIECIVKNLEAYCDEERGNDHDRYIKAFTRIGNELGFVTQTEYSSKGLRVDCVWIDRKGTVYGAIEVETSGGIKKGIVSTWELEPQLAIILSRTKTDKSILNLTEYALLKVIPHPLIIINAETKMLYYFERQEIIVIIQLITPKEKTEGIKEI